MPIPTRSQSVSNRAESGIPTRQVSVRQQAQNTTKSTIPSGLAVPKARPKVTESLETQIKPTSLREPRSVSKVIPSQVRSTPTANVTATVGRVPTTNAATRTASEIKRPLSLAQPKTISQTATSARTHTRSISAASVAANKQPLTGSRVATQKPDSVVQTRSTALRKRPVDTIISGAVETAVPDTTLSNFRDELLQLQLVHVNSSRNLTNYKDQVAKSIDLEKEKILKEQQEVLELEINANEAENSQTLRQWLDHNQNRTDEQKVQHLSMIFIEVDKYINQPELLSPLHKFESWLSEALLVMESRTSVADADLRFTDTLGTPWRTQMSDLQKQLSDILAMLSEVGDAVLESGLAIALGKSTQLCRTLLSEIETATSLEKSISQAESDWKNVELENALRNLSSKNDTTTRVGVWAE